MTTLPPLFASHGLEVVYGTDPERAGAFLELGKRSGSGWEVLAEMFSPEAPGELTFWMDGELPLNVLEAFVEYARDRLAEPGWGAA